MPAFGQRFGVSRFEADDAYPQALEPLARHDFDRAHDLLNTAVEMLPSGSEYLAARGLVHLEEAEYPQAEADFAPGAALGCPPMGRSVPIPGSMVRSRPSAPSPPLPMRGSPREVSHGIGGPRNPRRRGRRRRQAPRHGTARRVCPGRGPEGALTTRSSIAALASSP